MRSAVSFLSSLRAAGVSIRADNGRLLVEAPAGVITEERRAQLLKRKAGLITLLEAEHAGSNEDQAVVNAQREIAGLLAAAYGRYAAVRRVGTERTENSGKEEVAKSRPESVHGGVA